MLEELLELPERKHTIGPELIRFFRSECGDDWSRLLHAFLRAFAGTSFEVPGHDFLEKLRADETIIHALRLDDSVDMRLKLLADHDVSYSHMQRVWQLADGKMLQPPPMRGRESASTAAAILIRRHPKLEQDILTMFNLSARERVQTVEMVAAMRKKRSYEPTTITKEATMPTTNAPRRKRTSRKKTSRKAPARRPKAGVAKRLTAPQLKFLTVLKQHGKSATPELMKEKLGTIVPTKTISALVEQGFIRQAKSGSVSITAKGKKVAVDG